MNPNNTIVIHPNDHSTRFLKRLYSGYGEQLLLTEKNNNKVIKEALSAENDERLLMMLGHGCPLGLFAPQKNKNYPNGINQFGRLIINSSHVQLLRKKLTAWSKNIFQNMMSQQTIKLQSDIRQEKKLP